MEAKEIAALTPYSAQRQEIRKELDNHKVKNVRVKTITDSQGTNTMAPANSKVIIIILYI